MNDGPSQGNQRSVKVGEPAAQDFDLMETTRQLRGVAESFLEAARPVVQAVNKALMTGQPVGLIEERRDPVALSPEEIQRRDQVKLSTATITVYGQQHTGPASGAGNSIQELMRVGEYQAKILERLSIERPAHLFVEGESEDLLPAREPRDRNDPRVRLADDVRTQFGFREPDWTKLTDRQKLLLARHGAATVYAAYHLEATVHKTEDPELQREVQRLMAAPPDPNDLQETKLKQLLTVGREQATMRLIKNFLDKNLEVKGISLIFGKAHNNNWDKSFPDKNVNPIAVNSWDRRFAPGEAPVNRHTLFEMKDPEQILNALPRIEVDPRDFRSVDEFKQELEDLFVANLPAELDPATKELHRLFESRVNELFDQKKPPFKIFHCPPDSPALVEFQNDEILKDLSAWEQAKEIGRQSDIAIQDEMVSLATRLAPTVISEIMSFRSGVKALDKIEADPTIWKTPEALRDYLLDKIPPDDEWTGTVMSPVRRADLTDLHQRIKELYDSREGPFKVYPRAEEPTERSSP